MIAKQKKREPKQLKVVDETIDVPCESAWCLEDADFEDVADFDESLTDEVVEELANLNVTTMGAIWEYAVNRDHEELLALIEQYCDRHPEAPRPVKQPTPASVDAVQAKAEAFDEVVRAQQIAAECFIIFENAKEAAKVAKEAYESAKESVMSLVRNRNQEITNPQRVLF